MPVFWLGSNRVATSSNGVYNNPVVFIETPTFTLITSLLSDDEYVRLQKQILEDAECGDLMRGRGGIRKLRFAVQGRGKSGGVRVIYYWAKRMTASTC